MSVDFNNGFSRRHFLGTMAGGALAAAGFSAHAQSALSGSAPIKLLCGFNAGGTSDIVARIAAKAISESLGITVVVENKAGAGGMIAAEQTVRSNADGRTLFLGSNATLVLNSALRADMRYNPERDFRAIGPLANAPLLVLVRPDLPVNSLSELIALAKKEPDTITMGSAGVGAATHLGGEYMASLMGVKFAHVPFSGETPALTATAGGHVDVSISAVTAALPHVRGGRIKALAVMNPKRLSALPEVPTTFELGFADSAASSWFGLVAPSGTPQPIIDQLSKALVEGMSTDATAKALLAAGVEPMTGSATDFDQFVAKEVGRWHPLIKKLDIKAV